jgi:phage shock protein A
MNPLRFAIPVLLIGGAVAAWNFSPALRGKARSAFDKYGAWTEEARAEDPEGYMKYAIDKLKSDLGKFKQAQVSLKATRKSTEDKLAKNSDLHTAAVEMTEAFKLEYKAAEAGGGYPVNVLASSYDRPQLINQVKLALAQRDNYSGAIGAFSSALAQIDETSTQLAGRVISVQTSISKLETQLEIFTIENLTQQTEDLLATVNDLLGQNDKILEDDPVRTVEDLLEAAKAEEAASEEAEAAPDDVMSFLEG